MWIERQISKRLKHAIATRPVILLTGARQTGKTSLLKKTAASAEYLTLDNIMLATEAEESPSAFLSRFKGQVIIDEIQYAPTLFRELKIHIDRERRKYGKWLLTGSQKIQLMKKVSESLAGRIGIITLETLSVAELRSSSYFKQAEIENFIHRGGFPELWSNRCITASDFHEDYIQTYLERDLKEIINVNSLRQFRRMLQFCALRTGQLMNYSEIAKDTGVSLNTVRNWVHALETSGTVYLLAPFHANVGKRLAKSPKLFFADHGLAAHLLGVNATNYQTSPHRGSLWENLVFSEILKLTAAVPGRNLFYYRDQNNVEVDFVYETPSVRYLVEAKTAERVDERKLNFAKVAPLFKDKEVKSLLMSSIDDASVVRLKNYAIANPLRVNYFENK
jgi:predicted AAA+ superfamily ATPase